MVCGGGGGGGGREPVYVGWALLTETFHGLRTGQMWSSDRRAWKGVINQL